MEQVSDITIVRKRIRLNGIVQGVGFRPFVYRLAATAGVSGFVANSGEGVLIEVEGVEDHVAAFEKGLNRQAPPLARIVRLTSELCPACGDAGFTIRETVDGKLPETLIAPDVATCDDCLAELFDPGDRRYRYPFTNCTNCGPRYTIVRQIPYDRPNTSMDEFEMCPECAREYRDPGDRRFHAQPNACPVCGPELLLLDGKGQERQEADPVAACIQLLREGSIVAIRGLGGFHLAADAGSEAAVHRLRARKGRVGKPFAMMAGDVTRIRDYCRVTCEDEQLLLSPPRPIVLLDRLPHASVAPSVAPGQRTLGFMLPYTPLHHLLMKDWGSALVMTSANRSEEPIATDNLEALERLAGIADFFLCHDRDILQRCDDSVARVASGRPRLIRRSRGFVPVPVSTPIRSQRPVLACGGELKNTIAYMRHDQVFLSQHIGDLDNPAALGFFADCIAHFASTLEIEHEAIAYDLHPGYLSTRWALRQRGKRLIGVQHHHAHLAAVMAENGVTGPTIGLILDGTGYGLDGTIWGGEVLVGDYHDFERFAWLQPVALPGGEAAIRSPWRTAVAALYRAVGAATFALDMPGIRERSGRETELVLQMIEQGINSPACSSAGRLFDAVSALCGVRSEITYEAQAAIELEAAASPDGAEPYGVGMTAGPARGELSTDDVILRIVDDVLRGVDVSIISARFHATLAELFAMAAVGARDAHRVEQVGLSGGVFQNKLLFDVLTRRLNGLGFDVLTHADVPCGDGGLALGQAVVGAARLCGSN